jgi:hypothetical protein
MRPPTAPTAKTKTAMVSMIFLLSLEEFCDRKRYFVNFNHYKVAKA